MSGQQTGGSGGVERRQNVHLREIFDSAYRVAYPLLAALDDMGGTHASPLLNVALHEAFPNLHKQDIPILAAAVKRVYREQSRNHPQETQ